MTTERSERPLQRADAGMSGSGVARRGGDAGAAGSVVARRRTARLLLRRPCAADLDWMTTLHADPLNYTHAPDRAHDPAQARTLSRSLLGAWETDRIGYWIAEPAVEAGWARDHDLPAGRIGMAGVRPSSLAGRPCFNLYFRFVAAARGHGLAAEATREALAVAAAIDRSSPVVVRTREANLPARRLSEALGLIRRADLDASTSGYVVYVSDW